MTRPGHPLSAKGIQNLSYAGNLSPEDTWKRLNEDPRAVLIDVRTPEEWAYVGHVSLDDLDREPFYVSWLFYPRMDVNPNFVDQVIKAVRPEKDTPMLLLCRSGIRSAYGAGALTQAGFSECYNVSGGFEGDLDDHHRRGGVNGWKVAGLPWDQN